MYLEFLLENSEDVLLYVFTEQTIEETYNLLRQDGYTPFSHLELSDQEGAGLEEEEYIDKRYKKEQ